MNLVLHVDEIFLKGSNQPFFYRTLIRNLEGLFKGARAKRVESGIWLEGIEESELKRLALIPGIANFASAIKIKNGVEDIKKGVDKLQKGISHHPQTPPEPLCCSPRTPLLFPLGKGEGERGKEAGGEATTFRISAERSFKGYALSSLQLEKELGNYVVQKTGWKVNLIKPDFNIHISVGKEDALIFGNLQEGAGGLPASSSGKILALLSGGIDSPVAAYKMMNRGAEAGLIHFQNQTQVSEEVGEKILDLAKTLSRYQSKLKLFMVPFAQIQKEIVMKIPADYRMIITRRMFNRLAEKIAGENGYLALATGDSLGQVASQTIENLSVIGQASKLLILSPLIGLNKRDIINIAKNIGTFEISSRPYEDCCSLFIARHPVTRALLENVIGLEQKLDLGLLDKTPAISYHIGNNSSS